MAQENQLNQALINSAGHFSNAGVGGSMPQAFSDYKNPTLLERLTGRTNMHKAKGRVLEYFQAQLELEMFKGDPLAEEVYLRAMQAAWQEVESMK
jgi:hypothetical protein